MYLCESNNSFSTFFPTICQCKNDVEAPKLKFSKLSRVVLSWKATCDMAGNVCVLPKYKLTPSKDALFLCWTTAFILWHKIIWLTLAVPLYFGSQPRLYRKALLGKTWPAWFHLETEDNIHWNVERGLSGECHCGTPGLLSLHLPSW